MKFTKMHGLGNDFVIINRDLYNNIDSEFAKKIMDRNIGLGCDQFITYSHIERNKYMMDVWNIDGTQAGACGNAARCLAKLLHEATGNAEFEIIVLGRPTIATIVGEDVRINMGSVSFDESWMPHQEWINVLAEAWAIDYDDILCADIGNRHVVIFCDSYKMQRDDSLCESISKYKIFPEPVNVNVAHVIDDTNISLRVYEVDLEFTHSCGSGACVTFAAAYNKGFVKPSVNVHFKIGSLMLEKNDNDEILMIGPAAKVADGVYYAK